MPRKLVKLRIDEVSSVRRGAGQDCTVVLAKRDDGLEELEKRRSTIAPSGTGPAHDQFALAVEMKRRGVARYSRDKIYADAWNELDDSQKLALLAEEGAELERREEEKRKLRMRKGDDSWAKIVKDCGFHEFKKHIADTGSHGLTEPELDEIVKRHCEETGESVSKLWATDTDLQKAAQNCRQDTWAHMAERNLADARVRAHMAQRGR